MRHSRIPAIVSALVMLAGGASAAEGLLGKPFVRVAPAGWYAGLDAEWSFANGPAGGTHITSEEVNADDAHLSPMIDVSFGLPYAIDIELGGYLFTTDGSTVLSRNMTFGKANFNAGDAVTADASIADAYFGVAYRAVDTPMFWLSIGAVAHVMAGEVKMEGAGQSETYSESKPMAAVTARSGVNLLGTGVSFGAAIQWLSLEISQASIDLVDAEVYVAWSPLPLPLCIFGGYRYLDFTIDIKDDEPKFLDVNIAGPFAGVSFSF
jgi:hypothetical protein